MRRTAIYPRISLDKGGRGKGVAIQVEEGIEWVESQDDLELYGVYDGDNSLSASRYAQKERHDYGRLVADIDAGLVQVVAMTEVSRLSRDIGDIDALVALGDRRRLTICTTLGERYQLWTASGVHGFVAAVNDGAFESARLSERIRRTKRSRRREGAWNGGQRPFGYQVTGTALELDGKRVLRDCRLVVDPTEAGHLRTAASRILAGGSLSAIVRDWSRQGIRRPRGRMFTTADLRAMLTASRNAGLVELADGSYITAQWPGVFEREEWERLRAVLLTGESRKSGPTGPRRYLLTGLLFCAACLERTRHVRAMHGSRHSAGKDAYRCPLGMGGCHGQILAERVDDPVRDAALWALSQTQYRAQLAKTGAGSTPDSTRAAELVAAGKELDARLQRLRERLGEGLDPDDFEVAKGVIERERGHVNAEMARLNDTSAVLLAELPETFEELQADWPTWSLDYRRAVLRLAFKRVMYVRVGSGGRFDPERHLIPEWRS